MPPRPAKPADMCWIAPYLTVKDADAAIAFYERAFGFQTKLALRGPDGRAGHVEMIWHDGMIMFGPESDRNTCRAPVTLGVRTPVGLYVYCDDVDGLHRRATEAGAVSEQAPQDMFYGDRVCTLLDPDGHLWYFATNVADFDPSKAPK